MKQRLLSSIMFLVLLCTSAWADNVARIGDTEYASLTDAIAAVPTDGTPTTIILIGDEEFNTNIGVTVTATQNVIIDLNGHQLKSTARENKTSFLIKNCGTLTIRDASDINRNGTGTGALIGNAQLPDETSIPGYASNTIVNYGHLTVESGFIESKGIGAASYAIDNEAEGSQWQTTIDKTVSLTITGGKLRSNQSNTIRQYMDTQGIYENVINISNADMGSLWMQDNYNKTDGCKGRGSLTINNCTFANALKLGYYNVISDYTVDIQNSVLTSFYDYLDYYGNPVWHYKSLTFKNNKVQYNFLSNKAETDKIISDGYFSTLTHSIQNGNLYYETNLADCVAEGYAVIDNPVYDANVVDVADARHYPYVVTKAQEVQAQDDYTINEADNSQAAEVQKAAVEDNTLDNDNVNSFVTDIQSNVSTDLSNSTKDYVSVTLKAALTSTSEFARGGTTIVKEMKFDVKPVYVEIDAVTGEEKELVIPNEDIQNGITFRLPVDKNVTATNAEVKHGSESLGLYPVLGNAADGKYLQITSSSFSEFSYLLSSRMSNPDGSLIVYKGTPTKYNAQKEEWDAILAAYPNAVAIISSESSDNVDWANAHQNVLVEYDNANIMSYQCPNFVITDLCNEPYASMTDEELKDAVNFYSPVDFVAISGSYSRSLLAGYNSACVPFDIAATDFESARLLAYSSYNESQKSVYFTNQSNLSGGLGVIIQTDYAQTWQKKFSNTQIKGTPSMGTAFKGVFIATNEYQSEPNSSTAYYSVRSEDGKFGYLINYLFPFRACFTLSGDKSIIQDSRTLNLIVIDDGNVTAIENLDADAQTPAAIYTLSGQRVKAADKGIYIINGKKVIK